MTTEMAFKALEGSMTLLALGAFAYGPWQWVMVDWARQRMFDRRDQMFDIALQGRIDFASQEYLDLRDSFNSMIRFAHSLTWCRILLLGLTRHKLDLASVVPAQAIISRLNDPRTQQDLRTLNAEVQRIALSLIALRSPFLLLSSFVWITFIVVYTYVLDKPKSPVARAGNFIQLEARVFYGDSSQVSLAGQSLEAA